MSDDRQTYGAPRIHADLREQGERHSRKRIARLMREAGLVGASHRRGGPVTTRHDPEARPALDLVDRNFVASAPNRLWVADITYVPTAAGFLYLSVVLDAFSRRIVGWAMANHLRAELVLGAFSVCAESVWRGSQGFCGLIQCSLRTRSETWGDPTAWICASG